MPVNYLFFSSSLIRCHVTIKASRPMFSTEEDEYMVGVGFPLFSFTAKESKTIALK
jgi:hypothetical protein